MQNQTVRRDRSPNWYTNLALTLVAGLLGVHLLRATNQPVESMALAQQGASGSDKVTIVGNRGPVVDEGAGLISAAEQRKSMISELRSVNDRLERIESALAKGINVNVKSMPATKDEPKTK